MRSSRWVVRRIPSVRGLLRLLALLHKKFQVSRFLMVDLSQLRENQGTTGCQRNYYYPPVSLAFLRTDEAALLRPFDQADHGVHAPLQKFCQF